MNEAIQAREAMLAYAAEHLSVLVVELAQWQDTALLTDGHMRKLARMCTYDPNDGLRHAERMVERLAIRRLPKAEESLAESRASVDGYRRALDAKQERIDALMKEFCPAEAGQS